jgi:hypothetical protein
MTRAGRERLERCGTMPTLQHRGPESPEVVDCGSWVLYVVTTNPVVVEAQYDAERVFAPTYQFN